MIQIPQAAIDLVKASEGLRLTQYTDADGYKSVAYGHKITAFDNLPETITETEADLLLQHDLQIAALSVKQMTTTQLNNNQFAALIDFTFNLGAGAYQRSTLRMVINRGEYSEAPDQFMRWVYGNNRKLPGLITRRTLEAKLFASAN